VWLQVGPPFVLHTPQAHHKVLTLPTGKQIIMSYEMLAQEYFQKVDGQAGLRGHKLSMSQAVWRQLVQWGSQMVLVHFSILLTCLTHMPDALVPMQWTSSSPARRCEPRVFTRSRRYYKPPRCSSDRLRQSTPRSSRSSRRSRLESRAMSRAINTLCARYVRRGRVSTRSLFAVLNVCGP
jgi:hypothetical protein